MAQTARQVLMSVQLDENVLKDLQIIADVNDSSLAEEVRKAVDRHIASQQG